MAVGQMAALRLLEGLLILWIPTVNFRAETGGSGYIARHVTSCSINKQGRVNLQSLSSSPFWNTISEIARSVESLICKELRLEMILCLRNR